MLIENREEIIEAMIERMSDAEIERYCHTTRVPYGDTMVSLPEVFEFDPSDDEIFEFIKYHADDIIIGFRDGKLYYKGFC